MTSDWPGKNTLAPGALAAHYQKGQTWQRTQFWYETWRKTTALIDPPGPWDELDLRTQIAMCAVAEVAHEDGLDSDDK